MYTKKHSERWSHLSWHCNDCGSILSLIQYSCMIMITKSLCTVLIERSLSFIMLVKRLLFIDLLDYSPIPRIMENLGCNYDHWKSEYDSPNSSEGETEVRLLLYIY